MFFIIISEGERLMKKVKNKQVILLVFATSLLATAILSFVLSSFIRPAFLDMNEGYYTFQLYSENENDNELSFDFKNKISSYLKENENIILVVQRDRKSVV